MRTIHAPLVGLLGGLLLCVLGLYFYPALHGAALAWLDANVSQPLGSHLVAAIITASVVVLPYLLFTALITAVCIWLLPDRSETRCRKCHHTLRGLPAPICPECGEHI